ncbi:MAG TPA: hypothetical protein VMT88_09345 [Actinomycetes bacterium]|nr:hypothetical protein [Actinomycetes bacterium]
MSLTHLLAVAALIVFAVTLLVYELQQVGQYEVGASSARTFRVMLITGAVAALLAIPPLWNIVT